MRPDDLASVTNVINLYAMALDSHRYDLFEAVFTDDVRCDFGGGAAWSDRASLVAAFEQIHAAFSAHQHMVTGHTIVIDDDRARCLSYVNARFRRVVDGKDALFDSTGWYDDRLVRTAAGWRIDDRISRMVTAAGDAGVMQAMPDVDTAFSLLSLADEAQAGRIRFFER